MERLRIAVHKFSSCDGCQLAFLNLGSQLLSLGSMVDIVHFAEAGPVDLEADVDIAFIEGSITTPDDRERIHRIRTHTRYLIAIGACATAGGIQSLRNAVGDTEWMRAIYARPDYIETLATSTPIAAHVRVDFELWGCPVNSRQIVAAIHSLQLGVTPRDEADKVCMECKRRQLVCVLVSQGIPCLGPVTRTGCGALCPSFGRDCYGCYGPAENPNTSALSRRFLGLGLKPEDIERRYLNVNAQAPAFQQAATEAAGMVTTDNKGSDPQGSLDDSAPL